MNLTLYERVTMLNNQTKEAFDSGLPEHKKLRKLRRRMNRAVQTGHPALAHYVECFVAYLAGKRVPMEKLP